MVPRPLVLAALLLPASLAAQTTAFVDVTVVPMDQERVLPNHTVLVQDGRIAAVGPTGSVTLPRGTRRIDGRGQYLMPGLAEMHGHIPPGERVSDSDIEKVLAFYALNGVTVVRGMLGHPRHLAFRERAARGKLLSPQIVTSGPSFSGSSVPSGGAAVRMVAEQAAAGYDLMKIHPGIQPSVWDSMVAAAGEHGLRFAGHVPLGVGIRRALADRIWTVDHVDGYLEGLAWDGAGPPPESRFFGFNLVGSADWSRLPALVDATLESGAWIVPTQSLFETMFGPESPEALAARPEMALWPAATVEQWRQTTASARASVGATPAAGAEFNAARYRIMQALHAAGVPFLLGSDAPQWWNVPGYSAFRELQAMERAGFTPYEAFAMGTINVARHFEAEAEFGSVRVGRRADLVLLRANPLAGVSAWAERAGVMVGGRWLDAAEAERRLTALAK